MTRDPDTLTESMALIPASHPDEAPALQLVAMAQRAVGAPADPVQWVDALALAIAAGMRVGAWGLHRAPDDEASRPLAPGGDGEVMDADEVAGFLGVDRKTVYDSAGRGEIPCRRLGKRLLFSRTAIVAWLGVCKAESRVNGA